MVKMKTTTKDTLRLIRSTKGRFFSLIAIVMIGTAFFTGVSASSSILAKNVDAYNDELNLKDITIYSNYGFDEDDIEAVKQVEGVSDVEGSKFVDVIGTSSSGAQITRIHSYDPESTINQFVLVEGRLPENENEVLAEAGSDLAPGIPLGSTVTLSRPDNDLDDYLSVTEVTIVGTIDTPLYLNETKENSTLQNQYIETYFYIPESAFTIDYDLELNVVTEDGKSYISFYDKYEDYISIIKERIEELAETQQTVLSDKIISDAEEEYQEGLDEYNDGLEEFNTKISDAENELSDANTEIQDGLKQLNDAIATLQDSQNTLNTSKLEAQAEIDDGWAQWNEGYQSYLDGKETFETTKVDLNGTLEQIGDGESQINAGIDQLNEAKSGLSQIDEGLSQINAALEQLSAAKTQIDGLPETWADEDTPVAQLQYVNSELYDGLIMAGVTDDMTVAEAIIYLETQQAQMDSMKQFINSIIASDENATLGDIASYEDIYNVFAYQYQLPDETPLTTIAEMLDSQSLATLIEALNHRDITMEMMIAQSEDQRESLTALVTSLGFTDTNATVAEVKQALDAQIAALTEQKESLEITRKSITDALSSQGMSEEDIDEQIGNLTAQLIELQSARSQIYEGIAKGEEELQSAYNTLADTWNTLTEAQYTLNGEVYDAQVQIDEGWEEVYDNQKTLTNAQAEYEDGVQELEESRADGQQELDDAYAELLDARQSIDDLEDGEWTVLDRSSHYASATFKNTVNQMKAIANIFPVFFLFVAALVCLTTMSRLIDEQRGQIGIMRALGYSNLQCASKYLVYASSAGVIGCLIGAVVGLLTFPIIIYTAWKMMYILPDMKIYPDWPIIIEALIAFMGVLLITTGVVCHADMKEAPSQLLRPKSPKLGKSTFIEHIGVLWNRLSFTWKVTVRNLLRYKKRLVMTILGVAGCTALLVTGFGIKDSIQSMVDLQFEEIMHYDGTVTVKDGLSDSELQALYDRIDEREDIEYYLAGGGYSGLISNNSLEETASVIIFENLEDVPNVITLRSRVGHESKTLDDTGVILSEKLAENLGVSAGDTLSLESKDGEVHEIRIADVTEMYIQHYVFMSQEYYESVFGDYFGNNAIMIRETEDCNSSELTQTLAKDEAIDSISFYDAVLENFTTMVNSLDLIVWVLIISSMSLAFVVLGNLININISERQKEIATLKVLGFHGKEIQSYIYKENNVLTVLGALCGLPIGNLLHHYIMRQVEMDYIMFGRKVEPLSFVLSFILTIVFGLMVNHFMRKKLKNIEMVESLKSVE